MCSSSPSSSSSDKPNKHWKLFKVFAGFMVISAVVMLKAGISNSARIMEETAMTGIMERNETTTTTHTLDPIEVPVEIQLDNTPKLWIHVSEWAEGMSGWRPSLHEILTLARLYNATLVEPCASNGRLLSCARLALSNISSPPPLRLRDMVDLPALKRHIWPQIATHEEFVKATGYNVSMTKDNHNHKIFASSTNRDSTIFQSCMCSPKRGQCRRVEPPLNTTSHQELQPALQQAVQNTQTTGQTTHTILDIILYRKSALNNTRHQGQIFRHYTNQTNTQMKQHVGFPQGAAAKVHSMLQESWNITIDRDPFAVLQWRPEEIETLDYHACATALLQSRKYISQRDGIPMENFILISPLSQHEDLMWEGVKQLANRHKNTSYPALNRLLRKGFKKLEQSSTFFDGGVPPDGGLLAIWDFVLAQTATTFSTCSGCKEKRICSQCSYQGHSVEYVLRLREQYTSGKQGVATDTCWPEKRIKDDNIGESSPRFG